MVFADKLIALRKRGNMSQEELARQIGVTRQSVSKWESMGSMPDLEKILRLSKFFDVSTDYLLKDEMEEGQRDPRAEFYGRRKLTRQTANEFIDTNNKAAFSAALGVAFCFGGPALYTVISELPFLARNIGDGVGSSILLIMVALGVGLFVLAYEKYSSFKWIRRDVFDREYGLIPVIEGIRQKKKPYCTAMNIAGWALVFLSPVPFTIIETVVKKYGVYNAVGSRLVVVMSGVGFALISYAFISSAGFDMLMQTGRYTAGKKALRPKLFPIKLIYTAFSLRILLWMWIKLVDNVNGNLYIIIALILSVALYPATVAVARHFAQGKQHSSAQ